MRKLTFKDLVMSLKKATASGFWRKRRFTSTIDFRGVDPSYSVGAEVNGLDINAAVTNQMPPAKDTILGKVIAKFDIAGMGLSKSKVTQNLKGKGNFRIENGSWSALMALKMIGEKMPGPLKDKMGGIQTLPIEFRSLKSDINISGGHLTIVNMVSDMEGSNIGVTGQGFIDFDMNEDLRLTLLLPIPKGTFDDLRSADGRVKVPASIGCKVSSPCPTHLDETGQLLAVSLAKNQGKKAAVDAAKKAIENIDNPQVKDLLKKLPFLSESRGHRFGEQQLSIAVSSRRSSGRPPSASIKTLEDLCRVVRLGEKVHQNRGFSSRKALDRAAKALEEFEKIIEKHTG